MALTEQDARALHIDGIDPIGPQEPIEGSLAYRLARGEASLGLTFAGQGVNWLDELALLIDERPWAAAVVAEATEHLQGVAAERTWRSSGILHSGIDLSTWAADPASAPSADYRASIAVSMPAILLVQSLRLRAAAEDGLAAVAHAGAITVTAGHSQGLIAALAASEALDGTLAPDRLHTYLRFNLLAGLYIALADLPGSTEGTLRVDGERQPPMAAVSGIRIERLQQFLDKVNDGASPASSVTIALRNTPNRCVLAGPGPRLVRFRDLLERRSDADAKARKAGRLGGAPLTFTWENLDVSGAFHHQSTGDTLALAQEMVPPLVDIDPSRFQVPVISCADGSIVNERTDIVRYLLATQFVLPVRWTDVCSGLAASGADWVADFGPGDGVAKLTAANLRGTGVRVLSLATTSGRTTLFSAGGEPETAALRYGDLAPTLVTLPDGETRLANRYTRATGRSPVILPGMTPTTVDAGIVAAAANAGFTAELAGGGQVVERIFDLRMEELGGLLDDGQEVVFNTLFLDPYLWGLHLGKERLVQRAKRAGLPISGVTVSAGIPETDEAIELLEELESLGCWCNAFKPGTVAQVKSVLSIAAADPRRTIIMHLEGGRAGGHHSWEDLDELLLTTYHDVRAFPNVLLCVGGGVGTPADASAYLTGAWAQAYDSPRLPVDGVLIGTAAMACAEAAASPQVKEALAAAAGSPEWVHAGEADGGVTSGRSQLGADIHELDNAAARCGRLLDEVAGDADAVAERRDEIVEALAATAKPYFGDIEAMTYAELLTRTVELLAVGRHGRYEDGAWPDTSYRERVLDLMARVEDRLGSVQDSPRTVARASDLDDPPAALARFLDTYPDAAATLVHPADASFFIDDVCGRLGKPVNFVPVVDANVRRWYRSDSLWQAQDDRYDADAVFVIPGPHAVAGIERADEPVSDLLARFEAQAVEDLASEGIAPRPLDRLLQEPAGPRVGAALAVAGLAGPVAAFCATPNVAIAGKSVVNPLHRTCADAAQGDFDLRVSGDRLESLTYELGREHVVVSAGAHGTVELTISFPSAIADVADRLVLRFDHLSGRGTDRFVAATDEFTAEVRRLFGEAGAEALAEGGSGGEPARVELFGTATGSVTVEPGLATAYAACTGADPAHVAEGTAPLGLAFSLGWPSLLAALVTDELAPGMLDLVHASVDTTPGTAWPPAAGELVASESTVVAVDDGPSGRRISTRTLLDSARGSLAVIECAFLVRGAFTTTPFSHRSRSRLERVVHLETEADARYLGTRDGITVRADAAIEPGEVTVAVDLSEDRPRRGAAIFTARGEIEAGGRIVADIDITLRGDDAVHPLLAALDTVDPLDDSAHARPTLTLRTETARVPSSGDVFAAVGGDQNPIHRSGLVARLAGLDAPIAHGMWTAARTEAAIIAAAGDRPELLRKTRTNFLSPVPPGGEIEVEVTRTGVRGGRMRFEAVTSVLGPDGRVPALRTAADIAQPRTAYVFPGQGIQHAGMGMDGYQRSAEARRVWDRADAHCRDTLGFSILHIVRENPVEIVVKGERLRHPQGVLFLTQFTQVAMSVLASAQVAELRDAGVFAEDTIMAGHSVGEYNALAAVGGVIDLAHLVEVVYARGVAMHHLVPRDEHGESGYRMAVARPHMAKLRHEDLEQLVADLRRDSGEFIQIVNFNLRGRQYAVAGTVAGLESLESALVERTPPGGKPPFLYVPGIDVPFHSEVLRDGVAEFRTALEAAIPLGVDLGPAMGRYVPNLVPRPFTLDRDYVEAVRDYVDSAELSALLRRWDDPALTSAEIGRTLILDLLAWQFASPVRWIETMDILFGELHVEQVIEVGLGASPTLTNLAKATVSAADFRGAVPDIFHVEMDVDTVLHNEEDAEPEPDAADAAEDAESTEPAPVAAAPAAPAVAAGPAPVEDRPVTAAEALRLVIATQAKIRPDQITETETIDEIFDGVSSRRNQVLLDLGKEFGVSGIDGAHEAPFAVLAAEIGARCGRYRFPGPYLREARDQALAKVLGPAGSSRKDAAAHFSGTFGLGDGFVERLLGAAYIDSRDGDSARGGPLGRLDQKGPRAKGDVGPWLDSVAALVGADLGVTLAPPSSAGGGGAVDAAAVAELESKLLGEDGVIGGLARDLAGRAGMRIADGFVAVEESAEEAPLEDPRRAEALAAIFDERRHIGFTGSWASARADVVRLGHRLLDGGVDDEAREDAARLSLFHEDAAVPSLARWFAGLCADRGAGAEAVALLESIAAGGGVHGAQIPVPAVVPTVDVTPTGGIVTGEAPTDRDARLLSLLDGLAESVAAQARDALVAAEDRSDDVALVTGASPGSIAVEVVRRLLRGGATVVVTTTTTTPERMRWYRDLYRTSAAPGAALHVVPANMASFEDIDALVDWLIDPTIETIGPVSRLIKPALRPTVIYPFAASPQRGAMSDVDLDAELGLRTLLLGVERLVGRLAGVSAERGSGSRPVHVVLPLSPNHGAFGGDGAYAEAKAALEVLTDKWRSEHETWGRFVSIVGARIGWVRGTGLMDANDAAAALLEDEGLVRTFSTAEMGWLLSALCGDAARTAAEEAPVRVSLDGGLATLDDLSGAIEPLRTRLEAELRAARRTSELEAREEELRGTPAVATLSPLPAPEPMAVDVPVPSWPAHELRPEDVVVVVAAGEVGPGGSSRTRWELEAFGELTPAGITELAWACGLIRWEETGRTHAWVDVESGETVEEAEIAERYGDEVAGRTGLRYIVDDGVLKAQGSTVMTPVYLERDFTFPVSGELEARQFTDADPERTVAELDSETGEWRVTRVAGTVVRVPRLVPLRTRRVAGQIPDGFDPTQYGIGKDMLANMDRLAAFNIVATVDAFVSSGVEPEELVQRVHPARIANTQGAGMGGMESLREIWASVLLEDDRRPDALQDSLINVTAAHVVQGYVGSYGPMSHPVAACATAAVSIEEAVDKIAAGKADVVVAGGFDDLSAEGIVGFADMNATADAEHMAAMGLAPSQMSRSNDTRRRGFVESNGGGTLVIARGDVALDLGLPVLGVVAYAGSFGDGIHTSIPAPGMGPLAAASGGLDSPLGRALARFGLGADDIGVVSKHDTSTGANDPNESDLHHRIQTALGRTEGNPLLVVSQKTVTGHSKGGAAAWATIGMLQMLASGRVPGNRNLDCADTALADDTHLVLSDRPLTVAASERIRAGLVTSLGFGHVSAVVALVHPDAFLSTIPEDRRDEYAGVAARRRADGERRRLGAMYGGPPLFRKRTDRRFAAADGSDAQREQEAGMLLDPTARLGADATYTR